MTKERVITICINGLTLKLSIPEENEEVYRKAAKLLNERISVYNKKFSLSYADILTMVAYEMTVNFSVMNGLASEIKLELDGEQKDHGVSL